MKKKKKTQNNKFHLIIGCWMCDILSGRKKTKENKKEQSIFQLYRVMRNLLKNGGEKLMTTWSVETCLSGVSLNW